ncbi:MAG: M20/M25/M40 family metallo-hydrolase [Kiritimatiellia bacterium]|nr:M20/M25/M40 family metallo-hydrolase [Kiritimatiellia bacterium]
MESSAVEHLMDLLRVEGLSGNESAVVDVVRKKLLQVGCRPAWIRTDQAHRRIPECGRTFETGNLIVQIPGTIREPRRMFLAHMDTVPMCRGAVPVLDGHRIHAKGKTAVRADNRTGVAALVTIAETLLRDSIPHPPLTLLFTIAEEIGLYGAGYADPKTLGNPALAFNFDSGDPNELIIGAIGATRWTAEIHGLSAHAGMHPEKGISAMLIFARAVADLSERGFFGKIVKGRRTGTCNVGVVQGGEATNLVTDGVTARGEGRRHDPAFLKIIQNAVHEAFARATENVRNDEGQRGSVALTVQDSYRAFRLPARSPEVQFAMRVARAQGLNPVGIACNGGLDANPLIAAGIPTITLGAGQHGAHSVEEYVDLNEYQAGCRLGVALATESFVPAARGAR